MSPRLHEMDAGALAFPDESFDTVVAMYVMTVVPEPDRVMRELERVCAAGGEVILVNHFSQEEGFRGWFERQARAVRRSHRLARRCSGSTKCWSARICASPSAVRCGRSACSPCCASSRSRASGLVPQVAARSATRAAKARMPVRARLPEPIRVRIKWQVGAHAGAWPAFA